MFLAYVTNVLVKMNMFRTRCMLFKIAKTIEFVSWGNIFSFCFHLILRTFQQPIPFCCNRSTTNLFMISFLSRTIDFFFLRLWTYLWLAETSQQPISQTTWLKVTSHCNHYHKRYPFRLDTRYGWLQVFFQASAQMPLRHIPHRYSDVPLPYLLIIG